MNGYRNRRAHRTARKQLAWSLILVATLWSPAVGEQIRGVPGIAIQSAVVDMSALTAQPRRWERGRAVPAPMPILRPDASDLPRVFVKDYPADVATGGAAFLPPLLSPPPTLSFAALGDTGWIPPDTHGSVGPNHLLVTLNGGVRIQNRAGAVLSTVTLQSFWSSLFVFDVFDPKSVYDPYGGRFVITSVAERASGAASLMIGVSQTSDPTGAWNLYRIDADSQDLLWPDYPSIGFTKDWIIVQVNMFTNSESSFYRPDVFVFDKASLYAGFGAFTRFTTSAEGTLIDGTHAPAITYDPNLETAYLLQTWHHNSGGNGVIRLSTIAGPVGAETLTLGSLTAIPPWTFWTTISSDFAPQLGSAQKINVLDDRMLSLVYRNGSLWGAHTIFLPAGATLPNRSSVQWFELAPDGTILQRGLIDDPTGTSYYAYPSLTVNRNNEVLLGYASFSASQYASGGYSFRRPGDPPNTMRSDEILKAGENPYFKDFGSSRNRWGDYSATSVDPLNDVDMWTIQEYAASPANTWGTWWGMISPDCGNGVTDAEEECDDANSNASDGCTNWCTVCGNTTATAPEECDDGDLDDDDGCDSNCRATGCGNGILTGGEICDDGNLTDNDGCDSNCTLTACGNGAVSVIEECDDGDLIDDDGCDSNCTVTACGNGILTGGEICDDGDLVDDDGCDSNCTPTGCGNGIMTSGEECDDGNLINGDDCESDCSITPRHDSVLFAAKPVTITIAAGATWKVKKLAFKVHNADAGDAHTIQLSASSNCPAGGLTVDPADFDKDTPGAQDSVLVPALGLAKASVLLTATNLFTTFNKKSPNRCTLTVTIDATDVGNVDPSPTNNSFPVEVNVIDKNDPGQAAVHETVVSSLRVVKLSVADGATSKIGKGKPVVVNADILPVPEMAGDVIMVSASDGNCPVGTVGLADFEPQAPGVQSAATVAGGKKAKARVPITVNALSFSTPGKKVPSRCTAIITATGPGGDTDASNNTAALVIEVVDKNDF